jgi:CDP-diacylglycerol--glycerol-3-phosphate 3-phosphatidyltransferase
MWRPAEIISDKVHNLAEPVGRVVAKTRVKPNYLTISGFLMNIFVAWVISQGYFLLGGSLILVAGIFDLLDGAVARYTNRVTKFGALLDSTLDRWSDAVLLFGLLWYFAWQPDQDTSLEMILIFAALVGFLLVSYVRARAEGLGLNADVGIMRRTQRILLLSMGLMLSTFEPILLIALWILAIGSNLTAAHRLIYVWYHSRKERPD